MERTKQLKEISECLANFHASLPLFLYGESFSGKTYSLRKLFGKNHFLYDYRIIYNNVVLALGQPNNLLSDIISKIIEKPSKSGTCSTFFKKLSNFLTNGSKLLIVLDSAEKLLQMDGYLISFFFKLGEWTDSKVRVIFVSNVPFDAYMKHTLSMFPVMIYFPSYSKEELKNILMVEFDEQDILHSFDDDFKPSTEVLQRSYETFLDITLAFVIDITKNLADIKATISNLLPIYLKPVWSSEVKLDQYRKMCDLMSREIKLDFSVAIRAEDKYNATSKKISYLTLVQKYLLVSSFIASNSQQKSDSKSFIDSAVRKSGKKRKTIEKVNDFPWKKKSPQSFDMYRVLGIFRYLTSNEDMKPCVELYNQIYSLIANGFLVKVSAGNDLKHLSELKCKCNVKFDHIKIIAKDIGVDVLLYIT